MASKLTQKTLLFATSRVSSAAAAGILSADNSRSNPVVVLTDSDDDDEHVEVKRAAIASSVRPPPALPVANSPPSAPKAAQLLKVVPPLQPQPLQSQPPRHALSAPKPASSLIAATAAAAPAAIAIASPLDALRTHFGHSAFRAGQEPVIEAVLGGHDALAVFPTGAGKSLLYQLPALMLDGLTIVVCPLIALMEDQVRQLRARRVEAAFVHSAMAAADRRAVFARLQELCGGEMPTMPNPAASKAESSAVLSSKTSAALASSSSVQSSPNPPLRLLYVTPELLGSQDFQDKVLVPLYAPRKRLLALFAIDESHCISSWGSDFRPSYRRLGVLKQRFPAVPILALTATATPRVQTDIVGSLGVAKAKRFICGFDRPNIYFEVRYKESLADVYADMHTCIQRIGTMLEISHQPSSLSSSSSSSSFAASSKSAHPSLKARSSQSAPAPPCGIIYAPTRSRVEEITAALRKRGLSIESYHAGLNAGARRDIVARWVSGATQVMASTVAFGMGIDKSNCRFVFHEGVPASMENYYQESGRAGRDGKPALAVLYYSQTDKQRQIFFASKAANNNSSSSLAPSTGSSNSFVLGNKSRFSSDDGSSGGGDNGFEVEFSLFQSIITYCEPFSLAGAESPPPMCRRRIMLAYFADPTRCQQVGWSCCDLCRDLATAQASYQKSLQQHGERRWQQRDTSGALSRAGSGRYGSNRGIEDEEEEDEADEDEDGADDGDDGNGGDDHASRQPKRARSNAHRSTGGFDLASDYFNYSAEAFDTGEEHDGDADDAGGGRHGSAWRGGGDEHSKSGKSAVHRPSVGVFQSASSAMAAANPVALPATIANAAVKDERWRNKLFDFMEKAESRANASSASSMARGGLGGKRPLTAAAASSSSATSVSAASGFRPASQLLGGKGQSTSGSASKAATAPAFSAAPSVPISADLLEPNLNNAPDLAVSTRSAALKRLIGTIVNGNGSSSTSAASATSSASSSAPSKHTAAAPASMPAEAPISIRAAAAAREVSIARASLSRADYLVRISALLADVRATGASAL